MGLNCRGGVFLPVKTLLDVQGAARPRPYTGPRTLQSAVVWMRLWYFERSEESFVYIIAIAQRAQILHFVQNDMGSCLLDLIILLKNKNCFLLISRKQFLFLRFEI